MFTGGVVLQTLADNYFPVRAAALSVMPAKAGIQERTARQTGILNHATLWDFGGKKAMRRFTLVVLI